MKRAAFALLSLCLAATAFAQWRQLGRNEDVRIFLNDREVQREGDRARMWQLYDYVAAQWMGAQVILSMKHLVEYDCARRKSRVISAIAYSDPLAEGRVVASENAPDAEWQDVPPGGSPEKIWQIACGKE